MVRFKNPSELAVHALSEHNVGTPLPRRDEGRDQLRRILQVGIDWNDRIAFGCIETRGKCGLLAEVPRELDDREPRIPIGEHDQSLKGVIPTAVVYAYDFEAGVRMTVEHIAHCLVERLYDLALVVEGRDNRNERGLAGRHGNASHVGEVRRVQSRPMQTIVPAYLHEVNMVASWLLR